MNNSESSTAPNWLFEEVDTPSGWRLPYFLTQLNTMWPDLAWPSPNAFPVLFYKPDPQVVQDAALPITKGMVAAKHVRSDLGQVG